MRFWITKKGELSIREQLVRQVVLGILSEDLSAGQKLPSIRALARRHRIHNNTVGAAYHDLLERGWLESRRGSGLYVRPLQTPGDGSSKLDDLLVALLQTARSFGHYPEDVLQRLSYLVQPRTYERILVAEPEPALREIIRAEMQEQLPVQVEAVTWPDISMIAQNGEGLSGCAYVTWSRGAPELATRGSVYSAATTFRPTIPGATYQARTEHCSLHRFAVR